jgi:hypothetical protein
MEERDDTDPGCVRDPSGALEDVAFLGIRTCLPPSAAMQALFVRHSDCERPVLARRASERCAVCSDAWYT